jgi:glycosyltransferase involved in cell wall biosynthesis
VISVIITVYQQAQSLVALLHCLRVQDVHENFEVLICDDGSSSETLTAIAMDALLANLDIRYIWQCRQGYRVSRSKNNAIRCATGTLLVFIDGDIIVPPEFLRMHREAHTRSRLLVCNPRRWVVDPPALTRHFAEGAGHEGDDPVTDAISTIVELARRDARTLLGALQTAPDILDLDRQENLRALRETWMLLIGFSFSAENRTEVRFDEKFTGWGPEDRELALRLMSKHGYQVELRSEIIVYHLEHCSTGRDPFATFPNSHDKIVAYLKSMSYMFRLYPDENLTALMLQLMYFEFDKESRQWKQRQTIESNDLQAGDLAAHIWFIENWLKEYM